MTKLMDTAISEIAKLPEPEQDVLAVILLEEIASERRWSESFAKSRDALAKLAEEALAEYTAGRTTPLERQ
ncbi:MAG: hypothetical protein U1F45_03835 [Burkholderiales bacterium]